MKVSAFFRAFEKFADCLANQPSQGKAVLVSHLLEPLELLDGEGYRRSCGLHVSSICITLQHFTWTSVPQPNYVDICIN